MKPSTECGGACDKYVWEQDETEVRITVSSNAPIAKRDVTVKIPSSCAISVTVAGVEVLAGELDQAVDADDCTWTIETNPSKSLWHLNVTLAKQQQDQWWSCVVKGEAVIDMDHLVLPPKEIYELEDGARRRVEKMLHEQSDMRAARAKEVYG